MSKIKRFVVMAVCQEDPEDTTVTIVKAKSRDEAFKKYITEFLGENGEEAWMVKIDLNDNPLGIGEYKDGDDETIEFESMDGEDLERLNLIPEDEEDEDE